MHIGCAKEIITPTRPMKLACADVFDKDFKYIHDDVYARCLVLDDGENKTVLMSMDLLFHDSILNDEVARYANEKYKVAESAVVMGYTHAHTAPASRGYNLNHHDDEYEKFLLSRVKSCLDRAMCSMFEGTLEYGMFDADFNVSRRGNVNGIFGNLPDFEYPRDREFWVMCARDMDGYIRSVVTNYACHPVFYPAQDSISGEFPARLCQLLDTKYYGCISLFFQSAGADVRPRPTVDEEKLGKPGSGWPWRQNLTFSDVSAFAQDMCSAVSGFVENGGCKKTLLSISSYAFEIELPVDGKPLEWFKQQAEEMKDHRDNPNREHAIHIANGGYEKLSDSLFLRASVIKLSNDLYIATLGGEPCFGVKKAVKKAFGDKAVCFIGYTDSSAYIVDDRVLAEGGYEPTCHLEYCLKGPFKTGIDERYTNAFCEAYKIVTKEKSNVYIQQ